MIENDTELKSVKTRINPNGRIVIPASLREAMAIEPGDEVLLHVVEGVLHVEAQSARVRRVQASLGRLIAPDRKLSDKLASERRAEARREQEDWIG
jgi:AbrB family looped-hinge helix DNA binding protein